MWAQTPFTSSTIGQLSARAIGPAVMGGRITCIEGVNADPRTLYVGTAGGGVWKTKTGGYTFEPLFDKHPQSIGALAIDQKNPETIWVGTGECNMRNSVSLGLGIFKSTDGGRNWTKAGLEHSERIAKIVIHPNNSSTLYVAVPGKLWSDSPDRGLYKTTDGGTTWEKILYTDEKTGCADLLMDPRNPEILYAAMWQFRRTPFSFNSGGPGSALFKSADGGKTWRKITNGLPEGAFGRIALAQAASAPDNLLAIVESEKTGLYISADAGETWKLQSATSNVTARPFYFSTLVVDPLDSKRVYRPAFSLSISNDGGYSFSEASNAGGWVHSDHHALWINPANTHQMYLGTDGGVYSSLDRGVTWNHLNTLPVSQFYHVQVDDAVPYRVYGGLQDNGSWSGPSAAPGGIGNREWRELNGGDGFWVQPDRLNPHIVYAESQGGAISRVNTRTNQSQNIQPQGGANEQKLRWNWNTPIVPNAVNPKILYIGSQYLHQTTDGGRSWQRISPDLTTNDAVKQKQAESGGLTVDNTSAENHCTLFAIGSSPRSEGLLYIGTDDGNLQVTQNGGNVWERVSVNLTGVPQGSWVSSIEPGHFSDATVYATLENHCYGDMNPYVVKSDNFGKSWTLLPTKGIQGFARIIREDPKNPNLLYLGTEMGLYLSNDGGNNWVLYKSGLPEYVSVHDLVIHPTTNDLVVATHGRGIYIVDNITPLRMLTPEALNKPLVLVQARPTKVTAGRMGASFPNTGSYAGPNPSESAQITYYLKDRLSSGEVKIELANEAGEVVAVLPGTKRKGLNIVNWEMKLKPPKSARGASGMGNMGAFAGAFGPMAMPGTYQIKITTPVGSETGSLVLLPDPETTPQEYALLLEVSQTLFNMVESLATLEEQVRTKLDSVTAQLPRIKDKKRKAAYKAYEAELTSLRKELTETIESKGITGEEKLRSQIGQLYVATVMSDQAPTQSTFDRMLFLQTELTRCREKAQAVMSQYEKP
jgi:photosystem II stability/assembly factor-like uncharacterized protein